MSKLIKLVFHPVNFFTDAARKRSGKKTAQTQTEPKPQGAAPKPSAATSPKPSASPGAASKSAAPKPAAATPLKSSGADPKPAAPKPAAATPTKPTGLSGSDFNLSRVNWILPIKLMLHTGEGQPGRAHLRQWIPQFIASGVPFVVVVRNSDLYKWVESEYPWIAVAYVTTPMQIEDLTNKLLFLQAAFYPSNTGNNIHLLRFNHLDHIFIGHGDSEKSGSAHKFFRAYDEVWTAGQAHIDRFANAGFNINHIKFRKVGRPNLRPVLETASLHWQSRFNTISMLYLPTWEGVYEEQNYSSLPISAEILSGIYKKFNGKIFAKLHPQTGQRDKSITSIETQITSALSQLGAVAIIENRATPVEDLLLKASMYICDISAVVTECLSVDAPIFVYKPENREIKMARSSMPFEEYAYTFSSTDELLEKMEAVINGGDVLAEKRVQAIDYFVGKQETLLSGFQQQLQAIGQSKSLKLRADQAILKEEA